MRVKKIPIGNWLGQAAALIAAAWLMTACVTLSPGGDRSYLREEMTTAKVIDMQAMRIYPESGGNPDRMANWNDHSPRPTDGVYDLLALSSGGPDGAFSAGILSAWQASGAMPEFEIVTGSSTGALIAPFIFAGEAWIKTISDFYTGDKAAKTLGPQRYGMLLAGKGLFSKRELRRQIHAFITPALMKAIAARHDLGRRLYVLTGNYDAQEYAAWNMGAIASVGTEESLLLFRKIIEAAISIPVVLESVVIEATAGDKAIAELHGDAGPMAYFYADSDLFPPAASARGGHIPSNIHLIVNNVLKPQPNAAKTGFLPFTIRTSNTLTHTGLLLRLRSTWDEARARGVPLRYGHLRDGFANDISAFDFNEDHLKQSYEEGEAAFYENRLWKTARP